MMMSRYAFFPIVIALMGTGLAVPTSADAQMIRKVPNVKMAKTADLRAEKQALVRQGALGKTAWNELKAALRSELRLREQTLRALDLRNRMVANHEANPQNPTAKRNAQAAIANHREWRAAHQNAQGTVNAARRANESLIAGRIKDYQDIRQRRIDRITSAGEAGRAAEAANRVPAFQVPQARMVVSRGQPAIAPNAVAEPARVARVNAFQPGNVLSAANPAAFPAGAVAAQGGNAPGGSPSQGVYSNSGLVQNRYNEPGDVRRTSNQYAAPGSTLVF